MTDKTRKASAEDYQHFLKHGHFPDEPKPSKYGNTEIEWGGETFDSKWEWERWMVLMQMEAEGKIVDLKRQVPFVLQPAFESNGAQIRAIKYIADFTYNEIVKVLGRPAMTIPPRPVIEDAKGFETDVFRLKWKLLQYLHRDKPTRFILSRKGEAIDGRK